MVPKDKQRGNSLGIAVVLVLMLAALGMAALGIAGKRPPDLWEWLFASPEDGTWVANSFDGRPVAPNYYLISVRRGQVVGGYDDCNGWSYQDEKPGRKVERMIISTLQECPEGTRDRIYWLLVHAPKIDLLGDEQLQLSRAGHVGHFSRCEPDRQRNRCVPARNVGP